MQPELFDDAETYIENISTTGAGFLYVLYGDGTSYIKIGSTDNVSTRIASLQTGCPHRLNLLFSVFCDDARGLESLMHTYFAEYHMHGDWFHLPSDTPRILELLAFLYSQSSRTVQREAQQPFILDHDEDEAQRLLSVLEEDGPLTIRHILQRLGLDDTHYSRMRVMLSRLFHKGRIGKSGRGLYRGRREGL